MWLFNVKYERTLESAWKSLFQMYNQVLKAFEDDECEAEHIETE